MSQPITAVTIPRDLAGQSNGRLHESLLVVVGFPQRPTARLHSLADRAWKALSQEVFECFTETLTVTSTPDAYRSYAMQEQTFRLRYTTTVLEGRPWKIWNGVRWYQRPGTAMAAVPGTSNHGLGLAVDACIWRNNAIHSITDNQTMFKWLLDNAWRYGFSWEFDNEEPWHIRYFAGDLVPAAVLDFEQPPIIFPPLTEDTMNKPIWAVYRPNDVVAKTYPKWYVLLPDGSVRHAQGPDAKVNDALGNPTIIIDGLDHARRLDELSRVNEPPPPPQVG